VISQFRAAEPLFAAATINKIAILSKGKGEGARGGHRQPRGKKRRKKREGERRTWAGCRRVRIALFTILPRSANLYSWSSAEQARRQRGSREGERKGKEEKDRKGEGKAYPLRIQFHADAVQDRRREELGVSRSRGTIL